MAIIADPTTGQVTDPSVTGGAPIDQWAKIMAILGGDKIKPDQYGWGYVNGSYMPLSRAAAATVPPNVNPAKLWSGFKAGSNLPGWMTQVLGTLGQADSAEKSRLYKHYVQGQGVLPAWQPGFDSRPQAATDAIKAIFAQYGVTG